MPKDNKKGLGTGLSALFGEDIDENGNETELMTLPITKVEPRAGQPRTRFDEESLQELADSIAQYGLIQPITVRKLESGYYQIIAGERRWRASRLAGLIEVPVRVIDADDRRVAEMALVENLQREDLNPVEEAQGYKSLIEEYGMSQEEAAKSVGRSRPAITNALRLLNLCPYSLKKLEEGLISAGHARAIVSLNSESEQINLTDKVILNGLSVRKTEQLAAQLIKKSREPEKEEPLELVNYTAEAENSLTKALNRKVKLEMGKKTGRIVLEFYDNNDREKLIENLKRMGSSWTE